tara:strand:- start:13339 stop:13941 length:603 start_codon:yes stop_codon:yes gene_type:complete
MNLLPVILLACLAVACNPRAVPVAPIVPAVSRASSDVRAAGTATVRVQDGVKSVSSRIRGVGVGIDAALAQADTKRAENPGSPDALSWQSQWEILTDVKVRNLFAESTASTTLTDAISAVALQKTAEEGMTDLEETAVVHDKGVEDIKINAAKNADDAAKWKWLARSVWVIIGSILIFAFILWGIPGIARLATRLRPSPF